MLEYTLGAMRLGVNHPLVIALWWGCGGGGFQDGLEEESEAVALGWVEGEGCGAGFGRGAGGFFDEAGLAGWCWREERNLRGMRAISGSRPSGVMLLSSWGVEASGWS